MNKALRKEKRAERRQRTKGRLRHHLSFKFARLALHSYLVNKFNFSHDLIESPYSPYVVVSNHLTNWDPLLIGMSFNKESMYYVATDHVFRMGLKSKLLKFFFSPIPRVKTINETFTVITIFRRLKENLNICIFAEGNTSFDGETGEVLPSICKLVKKSGVALITYRFTGSYLSFPRWARFMRRGRISGRLVKIYSPEELAAMSEDEIYATIEKDIYVNAYDEQKKDPVAYRGKRPAEFLETALYCCPQCKQFATLTSEDDELFCSCGFRVKYNEYGCFEYPAPANNEKPPFQTILDWSKWQRNEIGVLAEKVTASGGNVPIFGDQDQTLFQIARASHNTLLANGTLSMYHNRISVTTASGQVFEFPLDTIVDMSIITMKTIIFSTRENKIYEIHSNQPRSALKYLELFKAIKGPLYSTDQAES